ncbi:MAG: hypothetical protein LBD12_00835 [Clostridiales Family XIII bacterium]|jgi:DNA-directed RNA polymerase subunit RPC12/RpoP|nr:hypothetical protein [Clostridiales Family XIII bacterium]
MSLITWKCPNCGGAISFDAEAQNLRCPYCEAEFNVESLRELDDAQNRQQAQDQAERLDWNVTAGGWQAQEQEGLYVYSCESCGGEIVGDETLGATNCPFCDSPVVIAGAFAGTLRPNLIIPFKVDKERAKDALRRHCIGKRLVPRSFRDENHLDEIKGIYVPFWLFSTAVDASFHFDAQQVRRWSDSEHNYTETTHYLLEREGSIAFDLVPADGSSKMDDTLMEAIEPFDWSQAVDFQSAYMAGYLANKYDVEAAVARPRVDERIAESTESAFRETAHGYGSVSVRNRSLRLRDGYIRYGLLPVWLLNTSWKGQNYTFAMNGQTGKFIGDLPFDMTAALKWAAMIFAPAAAVFVALALLLF